MPEPACDHCREAVENDATEVGDATLPSLVRACVLADPDAIAIESIDDLEGASITMTRRDVWDQASRVARILRAAGVGEAEARAKCTAAA